MGNEGRINQLGLDLTPHDRKPQMIILKNTRVYSVKWKSLEVGSLEVGSLGLGWQLTQSFGIQKSS